MKRFLALFALGLAGCSPSPSGPVAPTQSDDGGAALAGAGLCGDLRFEAQRRGTGDQPVGARFLAENGYDFLVVDPDCRFWVQERPEAGVQEGTLSEEAAKGLSARLRLAEWQQYVGAYTIALCDGPESAISFGGRRITVTPACNSSGDTVEQVRPILDAVRSTIEELSKSGTPTNRARYQLVAEGTIDEGGLTSEAPAYRGAPKWPLSVPASEVATSFVVANTTPESVVTHRVEGDDVKKLWAIVGAYLRGEIGVPGYFVPVMDGAGRGYRLFLRGSVPFENESGRWGIE